MLTEQGYSGIMDFVLALLPWKVIWKLQMKRKEKVGIALAMSMGVLYVASRWTICDGLANGRLCPVLGQPQLSRQR